MSIHTDQYAEARHLVDWGIKNFLIFRPLACETNQGAVKAKAKADRITLDKRIHAKKTQINYLRHKPDTTPETFKSLETELLDLYTERDEL